MHNTCSHNIIPGKLSAFHTMMVLSILQEANQLSLGDQARSRTSVEVNQKYCDLGQGKKSKKVFHINYVLNHCVTKE